jgi:hypothetical protein
MALKNVGKLSVNLTPGAVSPSVVASSGVTPDFGTSSTYNVTFNEHNLTHLVSPKCWRVVVQDAINGPSHAPQYESPEEVNTSVSTTLANGSYYFLGLTNCTGFTDPFNVSFTVAGKALNISVSFEQVYSLTMNVSGFSGSISSVIFTAAIYQIGLPSNYKMTPSSPVDHYHTMSSAAPFTVNVSLTNGTYYAMFTVGASFAAPPQTFAISGAASSINVSFSYAYTVSVDVSSDIPHVTFTLSSAMPYALNVTFNGLYENSTACGNTSLTLSNGTYGMSGYATNSTTGAPYMTIFKTFTVKGANLTVNLTFEDAYHLMVSESGLLKGTSWTLHLSTGQNLTSSTTSLSTLLAKDTYNYTITASGYTTLNGNISLTANETLNATFPPVQFTVAFNEKGLPAGKSWMVLASHVSAEGAVAGRAITLVLFNGSYSYQILTNDTAMAAFPGHFTVAGANLTVNVSFNKAYNVTFHETGLPANTMWLVNLTVNGATETVFNMNTSKITANMSVPLSNATYLYTGFGFNNTTKYLYMTTFASFTVKGANLTVNLTFARAYAVIFIEKGLPSGTPWYIKLNTGQIMPSASLKLNNTANTLVVFGFLMEGNYTYTPRISTAGYTAPSGKIDLTNNTMVNVTFTQVLPPPPLIKATITIGFGTSVSNFVPVVSNVTNISYAMLLIQPYYLTGNQSEHLMIEINTTAGSGLNHVVFELLGNNGTFSSFGPIHAEDFGYVVGGTIILALTLVTVPWIAIYREQWVMSERKVN